MTGAPYPFVLPEAFALNADPSRRNVIPTTTVNPQRASWSLGFPPQVMTPIVAGGKPMLGPDMNGTLYALSSHSYYAQTGQPYRWNADVISALATGYAAGTLLGSTNGKTLWLNLVDGNVSDPDTDPATNWIALASYGMTTVPPTIGGVVSLTNAQAANGVIVISGALVGNLQLVVPTQFRRWLIVNTTTGGFSTTVKTPSGSGVVVGQGGFTAPTEVYGDGINIYNVVAPTVIPGDVAPTPNTYAVRSNAGYLYATYFNQTSGLENGAMSALFAEFGNDGFHRKISPANVAAQIALSQFAGQVLPGQVPAAAVTQFAAAILANAALTGTPTAPTAPPGTNTTQVATTAFVQGTSVAAGTGYMRFPNGIILQWGHQVGAGGIGSMTVVFPLAFPNAFWVGVCNTGNRTFGGSAGSGYVTPLNNAQMSVFVDQNNGGNREAFWFAIGN